MFNHRIFVKGYRFLSFAKNMGKNIGKNSKNLSCKFSKKFLDNAKQSATDVVKATSKRSIQKAVDATGDLIGYNIANKIKKASPQNTSETVESETKIPKEKYISQ